jgi:starch-binding outer membrane protein, SusD/RagB family
MKKHIIKLSLIVFVTLIYSCELNNDFWKGIRWTISNETFWNTENDLMVYNNRIYDLARNDNNVPIMGPRRWFRQQQWASALVS